jgi:RNA polymerase sigma factor (sigma-70 family)
VPALDDKRASRLYAAAKAERWGLPMARFAEALDASVQRAFSDRPPAPRDLDAYLASLHLDDLALACACAEGSEAAWEHLVHEYRPVLYKSADVLDANGGARELADAIYGELYARDLFRYFHGRSSLATWLRSVLAQRFVDRARSQRRFDPLPDDEALVPAAAGIGEPGKARCQALVQSALAAALAKLPAREQLRLGCYYVQQLTLAEIGRILREHEATCSRHLAKSRRAIRGEVEWSLRSAGLTREEMTQCLDATLADAGPIDLERMLAKALACKISDPERSQ